MKSKNKVQSVAALEKALAKAKAREAKLAVKKTDKPATKSKVKKVLGITHEHPGRPRYEMKFPRGAEWTFTQLMAANGVETDKSSKRFGKGEKCSMLTLRKNLDFFLYAKTANGKVSKRKGLDPKSVVVIVEGVTAEPDSSTGLGRRATLYRLRHPAVKVKDTTAKMVADAKAILAEPSVAVTIVPEVIPAVPVETVPVADNSGTPPVTATLPTVEVALNETPAPVAEPVAS